MGVALIESEISASLRLCVRLLLPPRGGKNVNRTRSHRDAEVERQPFLLWRQLKLTTTKYTKTGARFKDLGSANLWLFDFRMFVSFVVEKLQRATVLAGLFRERLTFCLGRRERPTGSTVATFSGLRPEDLQTYRVKNISRKIRALKQSIWDCCPGPQDSKYFNSGCHASWL